MTLEICYADVRFTLFVAHDRAVRGEVFNGQCHRGWQCYVRGQCLAMLAVFRDSAKLPGRIEALHLKAIEDSVQNPPEGVFGPRDLKWELEYRPP